MAEKVHVSPPYGVECVTVCLLVLFALNAGAGNPDVELKIKVNK